MLILEILGRNISTEDIQAFRKELSTSFEKRRHIRIIGVGQERVGKTTLCKKLLGEKYTDVEKTISIETHIYTAVLEESGTKENILSVKRVPQSMSTNYLRYFGSCMV